MANTWTDQPLEADGNTLMHIYVADGYALQIQARNIGGAMMNYSATVGNLFESKTFIDSDLEELLKTAHAYIATHVVRS